MTEQSNYIDRLRNSSPVEDKEVKWLLYGRRRGEPRPESMKLHEDSLAEVIELGRVAIQTEVAA